MSDVFSDILDVIPEIVATSVWTSLRALAQRHPELVSADERRQIEDAYRRISLEREIWSAAICQATPPQKPQSFVVKTVAVYTSGLSLLLIPPLLVILLTGYTTSRYLNMNRQVFAVRYGAVRHLVSWALSIGLVFLFLGMAPAGIVSSAVQGHTGVGLAVLVLVLLTGWGFWRWLRRRRYQFTIGHLLALTVLVALSTALMVTLGAITLFSWFEDISSRVQVPPRGWDGLDVSVAQNAIGTKNHPWYWAGLQWLAYQGPLITVVLSLVLVALWYAVRSARSHGESLRRHLVRGGRSIWGGLLACVTRSAGVAAAIFLLAYLAAAPTVLVQADQDYQRQMACVRNPEEYRNAIRTAAEEIRADPKEMKMLRAHVDNLIAQDDEQIRQTEEARAAEE